MSEPHWLTDALNTLNGLEAEGDRRLAWTEAANIARRNAEGFVVRAYDVIDDLFVWHFGNGRWPKLFDPKTETSYPEDPFRERRDDIPLAEFMTYLEDWYYPQRRALAWQTPEKAEV